MADEKVVEVMARALDDGILGPDTFGAMRALDALEKEGYAVVPVKPTDKKDHGLTVGDRIAIDPWNSDHVALIGKDLAELLRRPENSKAHVSVGRYEPTAGASESLIINKVPKE